MAGRRSHSAGRGVQPLALCKQFRLQPVTRRAHQDDDALVPLSKPMMDFEAWKMKLHGMRKYAQPAQPYSICSGCLILTRLFYAVLPNAGTCWNLSI